MSLNDQDRKTLIDLFAKMDNEDLNYTARVFKNRRSQLSSVKLLNFRYGDVVKFTHRNKTVVGEVTKINRKTVAVRAHDGTTWRVSPSLLSTYEV